ncbi:MAG: hypothetical protein ACLRT5_19695 [Lachnospiraceae bacterium]
MGGNVITNAGGMKAVRYGLTRDFVRLHRGGAAGWFHHEFFLQCGEKYHRLRGEGSGDRFRGNPVHPDPGDAETASGAHLFQHPGDALWQPGGLRGYGAEGAGAALCTHGH